MWGNAENKAPPDTSSLKLLHLRLGTSQKSGREDCRSQGQGCLLETVSSIQDREAAPMKSPQFAHLIKMWTILMPAWVEEISQAPPLDKEWQVINGFWERKNHHLQEKFPYRSSNTKWSALLLFIDELIVCIDISYVCIIYVILYTHTHNIICRCVLYTHI